MRSRKTDFVWIQENAVRFLQILCHAKKNPEQSSIFNGAWNSYHGHVFLWWQHHSYWKGGRYFLRIANDFACVTAAVFKSILTKANLKKMDAKNFGKTVAAESILQIEDAVRKCQDWAIPQNKDQLSSRFGFANHHMYFKEGHAATVHPRK